MDGRDGAPSSNPASSAATVVVWVVAPRWGMERSEDRAEDVSMNTAEVSWGGLAVSGSTEPAGFVLPTGRSER